MAVDGVCPFVFTRKLVLHSLLSLLLLLASAVQGVILDLFFISAAPNDIRPYFWFIADFFVVLIFALTMCRSYSYWKKSEGQQAWRKSLAKQAESRRQPSIFRKYQFCLGYHPLGYVSWTIYSIFLVLKISMIFKLEVMNRLSPDSYLSPQVMKMAIALTALVFFLFVEGHYDAARHTIRAMYIANIVKSYIFEIFDSITFLSMLFIEETNMIFSFTFENTIIAFGCITLILPSVCLYNLSHSDYGRVEACAIMSFIYTMLHLFLVNVPYMSVRIYLWATMRQPVSIFLIKNIFYIILTLLECASGFPQFRAAILRKLGVAVPEQNNNASSQTDDQGSKVDESTKTNEE
ncbi:CECR6/TMEM121 family, partial [Trinorchestia longiramus]